MPPAMTTTRGPYLSTNQPSMGMSHVSVRTKRLKATWIAGMPHWWASFIGTTK